jgi:hypothetical protein
MLRRCFPFRLAIPLVSAAVLSSVTFTSTAVAQNLLPIQVAITQQVQAIPDPPNPTTDPINVVPFEFDPFGTNLVQASWMTGIGCPTNATTTSDGSTFVSFTDLACPSGDPKDYRNQGLLLVKTGPTSNFAAAGAKLVGPGAKGVMLTELGYDLRKPMAPTDLRGSHCGAGAPRFNVVTSDGVNHFVGCNSPPAMFTPTASTGWIRLRWGAAQLAAAFPSILPGSVASSISIIFDEGQDASGGPDEFGLAVLDNIDVNGTLAGRGPGT